MKGINQLIKYGKLTNSILKDSERFNSGKLPKIKEHSFFGNGYNFYVTKRE
jgi:hypothetical protein